jgi:hypothetical protein
MVKKLFTIVKHVERVSGSGSNEDESDTDRDDKVSGPNPTKLKGGVKKNADAAASFSLCQSF